jgi:PAS domain S-box-containing protein
LLGIQNQTLSVVPAFEIKLRLALFGACMVVLLLAGISWNLSQSAMNAALRLSHTHEVLVQIGGVRGDSYVVEMTTQNYRVWGDPESLRDRDAVIARREAALKELKRLTADNPTQQALWQELRVAVDQRLALSTGVELLRQTEDPAAASAFFASAPVKEARARLLGLLDAMDDAEHKLLEQRSATQAVQRQYANAVGGVAGLLLLALLGGTYALTRRQLRVTESSHRALAQSQIRLQTIMNSLDEGLQGIDLHGRIIFENPAAVAMLGWTSGELIGRPAHETMHYKHADGSVYPRDGCPIYATFQDGVTRKIEDDVFWRKDGSSFAVSYTTSPMRNDGGEIIGSVLAFRDVSAQQQADRTLDRFFQLSLDMLSITSAAGSFQRLNPAFTKTLGWSIDELLARPFIEFVHPDDRAATLREVEEMLANGRDSIRFENRYQHQDGSYRLLSWISAPDQSGLIYSAARDVTVSRLAEEQRDQVVKELADFKAALDQHAIVAVTDASGKIVYVNDKLCAISQFSREELIGKNHRLLNSGHHPREFFDDLWRTIRSGRVFKGEIQNRAKDGSYYWVDTTVVPFLDQQGLPVQYIAIRADITERKLAEQALMASKNAAELANRAKDSFLATMSHEIRTPLGGLMGMLELLSLSRLDLEQLDTLQTARDSGRSLLRILNDILDWTKIEEGKLELSPRAVSVAALVTEVANTYSHVASANLVTLASHSDARLSPALLVDPLRLSQVLNNFVSNAIKFSPGGRAEIRAELLERLGDAEKLRFSVQDSGIGMTAEVQQKLFQRYGQASADTARMYGGTGLGLAICSRLAALLGGHIAVQSAPGQGSTFSLTLTLAIVQMPAAAALPSLVQAVPMLPLQREPTPDAPRVLVVDDNPINRKLMARQLRLLGLHSDCAENGETALALWQKGGYALVITDCHMPVMDGYAFTRAVRAAEAAQGLPRLPLFAWTANALPDEIEKCRAAGMDELLVKPVELAQIQKVLAKWPAQALGAAALPAAIARPTTESGPGQAQQGHRLVCCGCARAGRAGGRRAGGAQGVSAGICRQRAVHWR